MGFEEWNHTNLVLILKVASPEKLSQYRPISLCNFNMKIILKILANRLKGSLKHSITPQQLAVVPSHLIQESILVAHKAFHYLKHKKRANQVNLPLKLDFNKAYDHIQRDFLEAVLRKLGFLDCWIKWVMDCVSTVSFSITCSF